MIRQLANRIHRMGARPPLVIEVEVPPNITTRRDVREYERGWRNTTRWLTESQTIREIRQYWASAHVDAAFSCNPSYARAAIDVLRPIWEATKDAEDTVIYVPAADGIPESAR